ncbi:urease accessory protein UreD [Pontibaca salina]|uniref:Urease accessory protein UreD n=1 Tax=Pontibaca salina TaxID=2795731 RepID=A0A934HKC5_9RHOB|nr:urease accessory protein UreD [Pontibaca salina]MBI6628426.1 urease accessory protein UreD [Pontibaca salina]
MYDSSPRRPPKRLAGAMSGRAVLASKLAADGRTSRVETLRSDGPLVLRPCHPKGPEPLTQRRHDIARVALAAGTAGPLGGDRYALDVHVGAGSTLVLSEVSAMLVLPGAEGGHSHMSITVCVENGATFVWWPEPIIAAANCDHRHDVRIALAPNARMVLREEILLGRHGESPGDFTGRLRVTRDGAALYDQQLSFGPSADGWDGAAVVDQGRAVGSIIAVDPDWTDMPPQATPFHKTAALTPLAGPGVAIGAVAPDSLALRRLLTQGLNELGPPWAI